LKGNPVAVPASNLTQLSTRVARRVGLDQLFCNSHDFSSLVVAVEMEGLVYCFVQLHEEIYPVQPS
jgi:hypothetical protein